MANSTVISTFIIINRQLRQRDMTELLQQSIYAAAAVDADAVAKTIDALSFE